ncbi:MAG: FtsX-like permease family protein [Rhodoglobus sp.]
MRALDILKTAIGNSFRSRLRTTLTVIAIFIGAFTLTITNGLGTGINQYIDTQVAAIGAPDVMTVTKPVVAADASTGPAKYDPEAASEVGSGRPGGASLEMTDADIDTIAAIDGITSVDKSVSVRPDYIEWKSEGKYVLGLGQFGAGITIDLAAGKQFTADTDALQVIIPTTYVETMGFSSNSAAVGQQVTIGITDALKQQTTVEATVVGVQNPSLLGSSATVNPALKDALYAAQSVGLPASSTTQYGSLIAHFDAKDSKAQVDAIKKHLVDAGYAGTTVADQIGTFQTVIDGIILVLNAFAIIALLAAGFGIINTLLMSVQERTREIGLMKAMGMSSGRIFGLFSTEAVFIGFLGSAIGSGVAILVGSVISRVLSNGLLKDLAGLRILSFDATSIATVFLLVMGIAFVASVLPASRAARQSPIDSLRYE